MVILYCLYTWHQFLEETITQQIFDSFDCTSSRVFSSFTQSTNGYLNTVLTAGEESGDTTLLSIKVETRQTSG